MRYRAKLRMLNNPKREINVSFKAKSKKAAKSILKRLFPNVQEGFYDSSGFHPIRASSDYDAKRVGEGRRGRVTASRARHKRAKTRARRTSIS